MKGQTVGKAVRQAGQAGCLADWLESKSEFSIFVKMKMFFPPYQIAVSNIYPTRVQ